MRTTRDLRWMWLAAAFAATGASQMCSQLVLGRLLGAAEFGELATLYNLMNFVGVPLVAVQLTVTSLVARGGSSRATLRRYLGCGAVAGAVALAAAPLWSGVLAVSSVEAARAAALFLPAAFLVAVMRGTSVGQSRSRALAAAMCAAAVLRVLASVVFTHLFGLVGATLAVVAAEAALGVALLVLVRPRGEDRGAVVSSTTAAATATQVAMWLIVNVDLLWARRLLDPVDAGRYLLVGGVTVGLVSLGQAFLWHRASAATAHGAGTGIVVRSAAIVAAAALVGVPVAVVALPRLLGPSFRGLTPLLCIGALWAVLASVVHTSTATQIIAASSGLRRVLPAAAAGVAVPPAAVALFGSTPVVLSWAAVCSTAVGAGIVAGPQLRRSVYASSPAPPREHAAVAAAPERTGGLA